MPSDGKSSLCLWQGELKNEKKLPRSFNFMFHYIDDVLSLNNSRFGDFVDCICLIELEIIRVIIKLPNSE
jgi:hypothetical protein